MNTVNYAIIGCGYRLQGLLKYLSAYENVKLYGVFDPQPARCKAILEAGKNPSGKIFGTIESLLEDPSIDWVLIGSPNIFHKDQIIASLSAKKHVFAEKPIATEINDCYQIVRAHQESDRLFATGFTLRYAPIYRQVKKLLASGDFGKIISVDANENITPSHGAYIMTNWRRKRELAGAHILEKCVHDFDLLNWFIESLPVSVAAFGGNNMFVPENKQLNEQASLFNTWYPPEVDCDNPFTSDKSIEDNVVSILEYANGTRVQFQATMSNAIAERRMYFSCTKGTLIVNLYAGTIVYKLIYDDTEKTLKYPNDVHGHGGGDEQIICELVDSMCNGSQPICSGKEGLLSAVVGICVDSARRDKKIVDLREVWQRIGVRL